MEVPIQKENYNKYATDVEMMPQEHANKIVEVQGKLGKMEKELADVRKEVKTLKKTIKEIQELEILKPNLTNRKPKKVGFFQLEYSQAQKKDIVFFIFASFGSLISGAAMPLISLLLGKVINQFDGTIDPATVPALIQGIIVNFILAGVGIFLGSLMMVFFWTVIGFRLTNAIKIDYFRTIMKQEQQWFDETNTFEFATKIQLQTKIIENGVGNKVGVALSSISQFFVSLLIGFLTSWKISLVLTSMLPLLGLGGWCMAKAMEQGSVNMRTYEKAGGMAEEVLYQIKTVASFANFEYEAQKYQSYISQSLHAGIRAGFRGGFGIGFIIFVIYGSYALAVGYGSQLISGDREINENTGLQFGAGDVITVLFAIIFGCFSLGQAAPNIKAMYEACNASIDYFELKERKPKIDTSSHEKPNKDELAGHLVIRDVKFKYPTQEKTLFERLNMDFIPGLKTAIVGPSGIGKSTVFSLIERFYEPLEGTITLDDKNITLFDLNYYRSLIGFVPQEPVLFNRSIRDNIIFGRENIQDSMIIEACNKAYAKDFIDKYSLDYIVGVKGEKLSGGQRQRIAIARAILLKPKLLILDEATSALDNKSEAEVQKALDIVSEGVTTIIIAHKIDTIRNAHNILCFDRDGRIAEEGKHEDLVARNGVYADLYRKREEKEKIRKETEVAVEEEEGAGENVEQEEVVSQVKNSCENQCLQNLKKSNNPSVNVEDIHIDVNQAQQPIQNIVPPTPKKNSSHQLKERKDSLTIRNKNGETQIDPKEKAQNEKEKIKAEQIIEDELFSKARKKVLEMLKQRKCFVAGAAIFAAANGAVWPIYGILLADSIDVLSLKKSEDVAKGGMSMSLFFLALAICAGVVLWMQNYFFYGIGEILTKQFREQVFDKFLNLHIGYFDRKENAPGSLLTKLSTDTTKISGVATSIIGQLLQTGVTLILGIVLAFVYQWLICLINIAFMPLVIGSYYLQFRLQKGVTQGSEQIEEEGGNILSETVINTKSIFAFNMQGKVVELYSDTLWGKNTANGNGHAGYCRLVINGTFYSTTQFVIFAMYAVLFYVGGGIYQKGEASFQYILRSIFTVLFSALGVGIAQLFVGDYAAAKKAIISLSKILNEPSQIDVVESELKGIKKANFVGKIEFLNVKFYYPQAKLPVFKNLNFTILPGQNVAFVGASGVGKSTIISLIERFYDVTEGKVLIDDTDIKEYDLKNLRRNIGLVLQQPALFNRSIRENIRYGRLDATEDEIQLAAKEAIIDHMLQDENTEVKVSGGEKQRIAIARAILKNPTILLLDEATSALDKENEDLVKESLSKLMKNRTSVIIAHRLSTIINCDKIFVLEGGEIVEIGSHEELINMKGRYFDLYKESTA